MSEVQRPGLWRRQVPYRLLSIALSAALLGAGVAMMYHRIAWRDIASLWTKLDPLLVAASMLLYWLQYPINSLRIQRVMQWATERPRERLPPFWFLLRLTCGASFVAVAAPVGLAGDAAKIAALRLFASLSVTEAARCALFDRVVGAQSLCVLGLLTLPFQAALGVDRAAILPQLLLFAGLIAAISSILVFPRLLSLLPYGFADRIARVFTGFQSFLALRRLAFQFALAAIGALLAWGSLYVLLRAAGLSVNPWTVLGFIPLLVLVNGLPFLYMGWGGRELAMAATLGVSSGLTLNEAIAVSIAWGVVLIVTSAVNGIFLLGDWRAMRQSSEDGHAARPGAGPIR